MRKAKCKVLSVGRSPLTGHFYPREVLEKAIVNYKNSNRKYGEMGLPNRTNIELHLISHQITQIELVNNDIQVEITTLSTPQGVLLELLLDQGGIFRISPRGLGRVDPVTQEVSDFEIITFDVVSEASLPLNINYDPDILHFEKPDLNEFQKFLNGTIIGIVGVIIGIWIWSS